MLRNTLYRPWFFASRRLSTFSICAVAIICGLDRISLAQTATIQGFAQEVNGTPGTVYHNSGDQLKVSPQVIIDNENNSQSVTLTFTATWTREPNQTMGVLSWYVVVPAQTPAYEYSCPSIQMVLGDTADWYAYDLKICNGASVLAWQGCQFTRYSRGGGGGGGPGND